MPDAGGAAGEKDPLETPVGKKDQLLFPGGGVRKGVAEKVLSDQIRLYPAKSAGEEPVGLFQYSGRSALGTLMFD
jgi:hypothetical protein